MQFANAVKDEAFTVSFGKTFHSIKLLSLGSRGIHNSQ